MILRLHEQTTQSKHKFIMYCFIPPVHQANIVKSDIPTSSSCATCLQDNFNDHIQSRYTVFQSLLTMTTIIFLLLHLLLVPCFLILSHFHPHLIATNTSPHLLLLHPPFLHYPLLSQQLYCQNTVARFIL